MVPEGNLSPQCSPSHRLPLWPWCCHQDAQQRGRSSLFASTSVGPPVVMGPAAPTAGGNDGVSMSTPRPTRSQAPRASALEMDMGSSQLCFCIPFGPCKRGAPWLQHGCSRMRTQHPVLGDTAGPPLNPITWSPLSTAQVVGDGRVLHHSHHWRRRVHTCHQCTCGRLHIEHLLHLQ